MSTFGYHRPDTIDEAGAALDAAHLAYAGGTDLLPRIKSGLEAPHALIDLKHTGLSDQVVDGGDRITLGALVTLAAIERDPHLAERLRALPEAAGQAATPQIRNRATIAGNLLQRPRCWYYRTAEIACWLKGADGCPARDGRNEHHAIFTDGPCVAVHPSDLAGALVALDATVHLHGRDGRRHLPIGDLYSEPTDDHRIETRLRPGEILTAVEIDTRRPVLSTYRKAMDRAAWAFALVGVAAAVEARQPAAVRIVLTGVANTPRRAPDCERILAAGDWSDETIERAAAAVVVGATPLGNNRYKQQLAVALAGDAIRALRTQLEAVRPGAHQRETR